MSDFTWTPERIALCVKLWLGGDSAGVVARTLGGLSRSAVIGKMNRMGVKRPEHQPTRSLGYPQRTAPKHVRRRAQPAPAFVSANWQDSGSLPPTPIPTRGADIDSPNAGPWIDRTALQCAFPVGDETGAGQWSCCNPVASDRNYCPAHVAIAYNPATKLNTHGIDLKARRPKAEPREQFFSDWAAA